MELLLDREELKYYNQDVFASAAVRTLFEVTQQKEDKDPFNKLFETRNILKNQQPHNIVLHNTTALFLLEISKNRLKEDAKEKHNSIIKLIKDTNKNVAQIGAKRIKTGSTVFISSFNNQLVSILVNAAKHKQFTVFVVKDEDKVYSALSKKLKSHNITLIEIDWHSLNKILKKTDICLLGGEVLTKERGVFVKKGGHIVAESSIKHNVPVYVCLHTLKYDHKNLTRNYMSEDKHHEYLSKNLVDSYICEHGIFKPEHMIQEAKFHNKKLFR